MTEGCPRGSRGQVGMDSWTRAGRHAETLGHGKEGRWDTWEVVLAQLAGCVIRSPCRDRGRLGEGAPGASHWAGGLPLAAEVSRPGWGPRGLAQTRSPGHARERRSRSFRGRSRGLAGGPRTAVDVVTLPGGARPRPGHLEPVKGLRAARARLPWLRVTEAPQGWQRGGREAVPTGEWQPSAGRKERV